MLDKSQQIQIVKFYLYITEHTLKKQKMRGEGYMAMHHFRRYMSFSGNCSGDDFSENLFRGEVNVQGLLSRG